MNQIDLKDKVAIITGGAQGFGYSMVERFSKSGAKVVIWDKDEELLKSLTLPENVNYEIVDITSYDSVQKSTIATLDKNNKIDILINNAGIAGPSFKTWEYPIDHIVKSEVNKKWGEYMSDILKAEVDPKTNFPYLLPIQMHLD